MKTSRRNFLKGIGLAALWPTGLDAWNRTGRLLVNDVHSQLNPTTIRQISAPGSLGDVRKVIRRAAAKGRPVCIAGGRHAMGAQQFATDAVLIDTRELQRVLHSIPTRASSKSKRGCNGRSWSDGF